MHCFFKKSFIDYLEAISCNNMLPNLLCFFKFLLYVYDIDSTFRYSFDLGSSSESSSNFSEASSNSFLDIS